VKVESIARFVMILGVALFVIGAGLYGLAKLNIPLGRLPGDIHIEGQNGSFYFPITTSILLSIVLTVLLNVIAKFLKK